MKRNHINPISFHPLDFVPALSGLIGKTALATSFAVVWAIQYHITRSDFVFENVRLEMIIGSLITIITALLLPRTAPSGTLAPLVVMVPTMAAFGVHPFILGIMIGVIGIVSIKTKLFHKLIQLSGQVSKTSLTLTIGISGVLLSLKNLRNFFGDRHTPFMLILILLSVTYLLLRWWKKVWLIVPMSAVISVFLSVVFGITPGMPDHITLPSFSPSYWWEDMWGIGFGFDFVTIIRTLPFAVFILLLWAIDTVSITTMLDSFYQPHEEKEEINLESSILITSIRNLAGAALGGAQTSALWRSFLIPLFMVKRPMRSASLLLGILGIIAGFTAIPIKVLSFAPLIWSVLLFGIFLPFTIVGLQNLKTEAKSSTKLYILIASVLGVKFSLIITWAFALIYEIINKHHKSTKF